MDIEAISPALTPLLYAHPLTRLVSRYWCLSPITGDIFSQFTNECMMHLTPSVLSSTPFAIRNKRYIQ